MECYGRMKKRRLLLKCRMDIEGVEINEQNCALLKFNCFVYFKFFFKFTQRGILISALLYFYS